MTAVVCPSLHVSCLRRFHHSPKKFSLLDFPLVNKRRFNLSINNETTAKGFSLDLHLLCVWFLGVVSIRGHSLWRHMMRKECRYGRPMNFRWGAVCTFSRQKGLQTETSYLNRLGNLVTPMQNSNCFIWVSLFTFSLSLGNAFKHKNRKLKKGRSTPLSAFATQISLR